MQHNSSALTRVKGADQNNPHWAVFQYEASLEQLRAIIAGARHCQQMLEFYCRRSRLRDPQGRCPQCAQVSSLCRPLPAPARPCQPLPSPPPLLRRRWRQHGVQVWLDPGEDASLSPVYPDCLSMLLWAVPFFLLITSLRCCFLCLPGPHCSSPAPALIFQTIYASLFMKAYVFLDMASTMHAPTWDTLRPSAHPLQGVKTPHTGSSAPSFPVWMQGVETTQHL